MRRYTDRRPKNQDREVDDGADPAVLLIAARFGLSSSLARAVCELAHIGINEDRRATSGGRTA
jgi:hypothetical protein